MHTSVDCLTHYYPSQQMSDLSALWHNAHLKPGGLLSVRDIVVPGSRLRGKKADQQRQAGGYVNTFLQMSGWRKAWSQSEWGTLLQQNGFVVVHEAVTAVSHTFDTWAAPHLSSPDRLRLRVLLTQAPLPVLDYLTPHFAGDRITFHLSELWIIGRWQMDGREDTAVPPSD